MSRFRVLFSTVLLLIGLHAGAWSSKGHQVVAYIAKCHLNPEATAKVNSILNGNSMVFFASWLDQVVNTPAYSYTSTWHYLNVNEGETYETRESLSYTDAVKALYAMADSLKNPRTSAAGKEFALKVIIHVVGDIHQPLHAGRASDRGGNSIYVNFLGEPVNLHSLWDYHILYNCHDWSYYQWQQNIDVLNEDEAEEIAKGSIDDWAKESVALASLVYTSFPKNTNVNMTDVEEWTPTVELQLLRGGLRLAAFINSLLTGQSGIAPTVEDKDATVVVYNLQGVPVTVYKNALEDVNTELLPPGFYVTSRGEKLIIR